MLEDDEYYEQIGFSIRGDIFDENYEEPADINAVQKRNLPADYSIMHVVEHHLRSNPGRRSLDLKCVSRTFGALEVKVVHDFGNDELNLGHWSIDIRRSKLYAPFQDFCADRKAEPTQLCKMLSNNGQAYIDFGKTRVYFVN